MKGLIAGLSALLVLAGAAEARMHAPYRAHRILPAGAALDGLTQPVAAYSFRKLRSVYAGNAVRLRRASDSAELDVGFAGSDFNTAAATTHCTATTCFIKTWYDQSGNARDLTQPVAAGQPQLIFGCQGTLPCSQMTSVSQTLATAVNYAPGSPIFSISLVANRQTGLGQCVWLWAHGSANDRAYAVGTAANTWGWVGAAAGSVPFTAADAAWHSVQLTYAGAGSGASVDGVEQAPQTVTGNTTAGLIQAVGDTGSCRQVELVVWNGYALSLAERAALTANQKDYWMPLPLDAFTQPAGAYSFRKLKSTYAGNAVKLRRASDSAVQDIGFVGYVPGLGSPFNTAAANTFCNATTCSVETFYDQSGNGRDLAGSTNPGYTANCLGTQPCLRSTAAGQRVVSAGSTTPATGKVSLSMVANRNAGTGICSLVFLGLNNYVFVNSPAAQWVLTDNATYLVAPAADAAWHAAQAVTNAASSVISIDGTDTTGTAVAGSTAAGQSQVLVGAAATTCSLVEAVAWDNYLLTAPERAALNANQHSFWGF